MYARTLSSKKSAQGDNRLSYVRVAWRVEQDAPITIDEAARPTVSALLDQFAMVSGAVSAAAAAKQGGSKSGHAYSVGSAGPRATNKHTHTA